MTDVSVYSFDVIQFVYDKLLDMKGNIEYVSLLIYLENTPDYSLNTVSKTLFKFGEAVYFY